MHHVKKTNDKLQISFINTFCEFAKKYLPSYMLLVRWPKKENKKKTSFYY